MQTLNKDRAVQMAVVFCRLLNDWLTADELAEVNRRNLTPEYQGHGSCATHDFCDPNDAMTMAFREVTGRECLLNPSEPELQADCDLMAEAWALAKARDFRMV